VNGERERARPVHSASEPADPQWYVLSLYVTGLTPHSTQAVANVKAICEQHLAGRYDLQVVDLHQQPALFHPE
jgi:circadian clock protein KaiB